VTHTDATIIARWLQGIDLSAKMFTLFVTNQYVSYL